MDVHWCQMIMWYLFVTDNEKNYTNQLMQKKTTNIVIF